MGVNITQETYNSSNFLTANAADWIDFEVKFTSRFSVGSGTSNTITYTNIGNNTALTLQSGSFADYGFMLGDTVRISWGWLGGTYNASQVHIRTITYVAGNIMYISGGALTWQPTADVVASGYVFPSAGNVTGMFIVADKAPDSIEMQFNLAPNGSNTPNSVIDGEITRLENNDTSAIPTGVAQPMVQLVNKSGGYIDNVELTLVDTPTVGIKDYKITGKIWQWGVIKDGYPEPNYYDQADCLAPVIKIRCFAQYGNPNGIIEDTSVNTEANTGGYNENYNGGINNYSVNSIQWRDINGDDIDALDYSNECTFEAVLTAANQDPVLSTYRLALLWRPIDGTVYQNNIHPIVNNLLVLAPQVDFQADGVVDPTIYQGFARIDPGDPTDGARWDFQDIKFEITGVSELTITGKVIPNSEAAVLFAQYPDDERKSTLSVSIANQSLPASVTDRVMLKLFDQDNYDAPTLGVQIPNVINQHLYDHDMNDITSDALPNTTTEDDVLFQSLFRLIDNVDYEGIRARIYAYNTVTQEEFTLEDIFWSFNNVVNIAGQFQPNFINPRGFNLPPSSIRNVRSLVRVPAQDIAGQYALQIDYGYLSDWRYWMEQSNVNNDFFDINEIYFDGKNKNWQRFYSGNWLLRLSYYTRVNGVDDFNHQNIKIRPYEDDPNVSTTVSFLVLSTGATPSNLVANEIIEVTAVLTWTGFAYLNEWAEATIEDFEAGNRWVLSSVEPQGNVAANPLKPLPSEAGLQVVISPVNVATLKFYVDTNLITSNSVSLTYRIYSEEGEIPGKETTTGIFKRTTTGLIKQKA